MRYIEYNNPKTVYSEIYSVFDNLYAACREKRNLLLRAQKRVSEYNSENLMYGLICKVLDKKQFTRFGISVHVSLRMILRDMERLDAQEKQYAQNILTHVDFLIFDKIGKVPRLVIEVDGTAFHAKGSRQAERDELKNSILEKYGIPYIRFRTDESGEEGRLVAALEGTMPKR